MVVMVAMNWSSEKGFRLPAAGLWFFDSRQKYFWQTSEYILTAVKIKYDKDKLQVTPDMEEEIAEVERGEVVSMSEFKTIFARWLWPLNSAGAAPTSCGTDHKTMLKHVLRMQVFSRS